MKILFLNILVAAIVFTSCCDGSSDNSSASHHEETTSAQETQENIPHTAVSFYKRYEGTISGQSVVVYLEKDDSNYNGYYYYSKIGRPITLSGTAIGKDSLLLQEYPVGNTYSDTETPQLRCAFSGEDIVGEWSSKDKKHAISLKEKYVSGSYGFEMKKYHDTAMLVNDPKSPFASSSYKIPLATGSSEEAKWLNEQIKKSLNGNKVNGTLEEVIKVNSNRFFARYRSDNQEEVKAYTGKEDGYPYHLNYDETINRSIRYNENGLVTIEESCYSYTGGAHGNYASSFSNYDAVNKKELKLQDVITADSTTLQRVLEQQFRKDYNIPAPKPLTEILFEPHLAATDNFYLNEKGLGFLYNPYEVAPYVVGQIEVFIPYTVLNNYLTPEFKKRISGSK